MLILCFELQKKSDLHSFALAKLYKASFQHKHANMLIVTMLLCWFLASSIFIKFTILADCIIQPYTQNTQYTWG